MLKWVRPLQPIVGLSRGGQEEGAPLAHRTASVGSAALDCQRRDIVRVRLTDQAAVAVALARRAAGDASVSIGHLVVGLTLEPDGRAGRRLRERPTAAAIVADRVTTTPAPAIDVALQRAGTRAGRRAVGTVDLLDAALAEGGAALAGLLDEAGYHRDLDGWLAGDPDLDWFDNAETYGFDPAGTDSMDPAASRVVAQVRAVDGGAVEILIAAAAAPESPQTGADPRDLAVTAQRLRGSTNRWDVGVEAVLAAAEALRGGDQVTVADLMTAALVAGGDGPRLVAEFTSEPG